MGFVTSMKGRSAAEAKVKTDKVDAEILAQLPDSPITCAGAVGECGGRAAADAAIGAGGGSAVGYVHRRSRG
jgi:hypothetical protein